MMLWIARRVKQGSHGEDQMAIDINQLAERIADAVEAAPELAQQLVENPVATVERITGVTGGYDLTELFGLCLARLAEAGVDLSTVDLGKLDLSAIDVSRLSPDEHLEDTTIDALKAIPAVYRVRVIK